MGLALPFTIEIILLVVALSIDAFVASFAYGTNKIKIPFVSVCVISAVCSGMFVLSLFLGSVISPYLPENAANVVCFLILIVLGLVKLFDGFIKIVIRKYQINKKMKFSFLNLHFILRVYADPVDADADRSRTLAPLESVSVAIALSLDGLAVGFGAGMGEANVWYALAVSLVLSAVSVIAGCFLGRKLAEKTSLNLSWIGGVLLILLAVTKL